MTHDEAIDEVERCREKARKLYALAKDGNGTTDGERLSAALGACRYLSRAYEIVVAAANGELAAVERSG